MIRYVLVFGNDRCVSFMLYSQKGIVIGGATVYMIPMIEYSASLTKKEKKKLDSTLWKQALIFWGFNPKTKK